MEERVYFGVGGGGFCWRAEIGEGMGRDWRTHFYFIGCQDRLRAHSYWAKSQGRIAADPGLFGEDTSNPVGKGGEKRKT